MAKVHTFNIIADPGHAWLMTTRTRLAEAGLTEADISAYSYQHPSHETIALECDLDMATFLSAYAYNSKLLVKENDSVKAGQAIALMGESNQGVAKLHFEIRNNGKPVNPLKYLPKR